MATIAFLPFAKVPKGYNKEFKERPSKPKHTSMAYPTHDPTTTHPPSKRRPKTNEPFDPEDLSRRLTAHLTAQTLATHRHREARAAKERALQAQTYHHTPLVAASAFARTATPILANTSITHKLSTPYLKLTHSSQNPDAANPISKDPPLRKQITKRPSMNLQRNILNDQDERAARDVRARNQFQRSRQEARDLEVAAEVDELRDVYRVPQRTFGEFAHLRNASTNVGVGRVRPVSMVDIFPDSERDAGRRTETMRGTPLFAGRNDWAQAQENVPPSPKNRTGTWNEQVKKRVSVPLLKRKESVWVLMGKKDKSPKGDDGVLRTASSPPALDKLEGKRSFLKRFMRTNSS